MEIRRTVPGALSRCKKAAIISLLTQLVFAFPSLSTASLLQGEAANFTILELVSRSGFDDKFVFHVAGDFNFDNSEIKLTGVSIENVVFNFLNASNINPGKAGSIFLGAILAPTGSVDYHNPATFMGSIIARDINLYSDFNIAGPQTSPIPVPGAHALFLTGLFDLAFTRRKRDAARA